MGAPTPNETRVPGTRISLEGEISKYLAAVSHNWLTVAPFSNPGMLEMFRDRDRKPRRNLLRWAGWFAGMHLVSSVQMLRTNDDPELRSHVGWLVGQLLALQAEDGYLGPFPKGYRLLNFAPNVQGHEDVCWDTSAHYYVMLGFILWYEDCQDSEVLDAARRIADAICRLYLGKRERRLVDTGYSEMNLAPAHSLMLLYRITLEETYLQMARQIVDEEFSATASGGEHLAGDYLEAGLRGDEFYMLPKPRWESLHPMMAMVELHYVTGEEKYRIAFEHFWWSIVRTDRHNNGGFTTGEKAIGNPYSAGAIESCCTLAWMAYSVEMLKLTGNSVVADEIELSTLNSVIGMHSHTGRWSTYNTPMDGVRRASTHDITFQAREGTPELNCCSVHTPRGFGLISEWAVVLDSDAIIVNFYGPGTTEVDLPQGSTVRLIQETEYPVGDKIRLAVEAPAEEELEVRLRIPHWSAKTTVRLLSGNADGPSASEVWNPDPASYITIVRHWNSGDVVELQLDMSLHFWKGEGQCTGKTSVYRGPLLLAYDRRFNQLDPDAVPRLDARSMEGELVDANAWIEPILLLEFQTESGPIRLSDFGSAGEAGSPYWSWLDVDNVPDAGFAENNPLRSARAR